MVGPPSAPELLVYDGDCGFCTSAANWIANRWWVGPRAVTYQTVPNLAEIGLTRAEAADAAWWVDASGRYRGHRAIGQALLRARSRGYRALGRFVLLPGPVDWLGAVVYHWISRNRHRLPGGQPMCSSNNDATTSGASSGNQ